MREERSKDRYESREKRKISKYSASPEMKERKLFRSRSNSVDSYERRRYYGTREFPKRSRVLGVFGLSYHTRDYDLFHEFGKFGPIEDIQIIYDVKTRLSRGFAFIYFDHSSDASRARRVCNGMYLHGKRIRVDYSITRRPHTPTPGIYMGEPTRKSRNSYSSASTRSRSR